jgi:hypothetical protein
LIAAAAAAAANPFFVFTWMMWNLSRFPFSTNSMIYRETNNITVFVFHALLCTFVATMAAADLFMPLPSEANAAIKAKKATIRHFVVVVFVAIENFSQFSFLSLSSFLS